MNFFTVIHWMVMFVIIYLLLMLMRIVILRHLWIWPRIAPVQINQTISNTAAGCMNYIFGFVITFVIIIYIIWLIVRKIVPWPFKKIIKKLSPFREFERAGVFGLLDAIRKLFWSRMSLKDRIKGIGMALYDFLRQSMGLVVEDTKGILTRNFVRGEQGANMGPLPQSEPGVDGPDTAYIMGDEDNRKIQQLFEECMEQRTKTIYPDMSVSDVKAAQLSNMQAETICRVQQFKDYSYMFMSK